jgi:predicted kinase
VPQLIVLNGPPACGKSTLAQMYVDEHPLALNLDIDRIRGLIGQWQRDPHGAGLLARAVALAAARTHLLAGYDVVIPQFLGRPEFLEQCQHLAQELSVQFQEIILLDSKENVLRRLAERTQLSADPAHVEAQELLDRSGGITELSAMYDRLLSIVASRPAVKIVQTTHDEPERAYRLFLDTLG